MGKDQRLQNCSFSTNCVNILYHAKYKGSAEKNDNTKQENKGP